MMVIGLTGSIGMGKSTLAAMLETMKIPVHDSDAAVHELTAPGGAALMPIFAAFPYFSYPQIYGPKDKSGQRTLRRDRLGAVVFKNPSKRKILESILHPLVQQSQQDFLRRQKALGRDLAVLDIPLLFETGAERRVDAVIVVSAPAHVQRARVLARPGMSAEKFEAIKAAQLSDGEKRARANYVIQTGLGKAYTMRELRRVLGEIRGRAQDTNRDDLSKTPL